MVSAESPCLFVHRSSLFTFYLSFLHAPFQTDNGLPTWRLPQATPKQELKDEEENKSGLLGENWAAVDVCTLRLLELRFSLKEKREAKKAEGQRLAGSSRYPSLGHPLPDLLEARCHLAEFSEVPCKALRVFIFTCMLIWDC